MLHATVEAASDRRHYRDRARFLAGRH